jgi:cytochrome c biogenesis protein CcmG/thiol:disulfide interchange protein DsbE
MSGNKTGLIVGIAGGVVVLLLIAAVLFANEEVGAEYGTPVIQGQGLPLMPPQSPVDETANGSLAPTVIGQDFDNNTVKIDNADGKAKGIVFLAHWCPHCQAEVPRVQAWLDATGGVPGVELYSVATAMNSGQPNFPSSDWLAGENWSVPVIRDDQQDSVLAAYGSGGFPYWVFTNADGTVALRTAGELTIVQLEEVLASLEQ